MPPPDKFDDRWYSIAALVLVILLVVVLVVLFYSMAPTTI
jgi:hypothetical protein